MIGADGDFIPRGLAWEGKVAVFLARKKAVIQGPGAVLPLSIGGVPAACVGRPREGSAKF